MAYGEQMKKLRPCGDRKVLEALASACPDMKTLLDAGCGRGDRLAAIGAAMPEVRRSGVELDPENAAAAGAKCPDTEIVVGDICALGSIIAGKSCPRSFLYMSARLMLLPSAMNTDAPG